MTEPGWAASRDRTGRMDVYRPYDCSRRKAGEKRGLDEPPPEHTT